MRLELIKSRELSQSWIRQMLHVFSHLWVLDLIQVHRSSYEQIGRKGEAKLSRGRDGTNVEGEEEKGDGGGGWG